MKKYIIGLIVAGLAGLAIWAVMAGCGKKPTEPVGGKEYPIYFVGYKENGIDKKYYRYLPYSEQLDSFVLPVLPYQHMSVSADGGQLWIANRDSTYVFDVASKSIIARLHYTAGGKGIAFSPDNSMAALAGGSLKIISTSDYSIVFRDTLQSGESYFSSGRFSPDGNSYFCAVSPVSAYSLEISYNFQSERVDISRLRSPKDVIMLPESDHLAVIQSSGMYDDAFVVYSPSRDSILFSYPLLAEPAYMRLSPDGRVIYLTAAGSPLFGPPPEFSYAIYDIETMQVEEVDVMFEFPSAISFFPIGKVHVSPDGRWLAGSYFNYPDYLLIHDLQTGDSVKSPILEDKYFSHIAVQEFR